MQQTGSVTGVAMAELPIDCVESPRIGEGIIPASASSQDDLRIKVDGKVQGCIGQSGLSVCSSSAREPFPYECACVTGSHSVGCTTISMKEDGMKQLKLRRKLLKRARNGDGKAQAELMASYGVRVYSEAERASLVHYTVPKSPRNRSTKAARKK